MTDNTSSDRIDISRGGDGDSDQLPQEDTLVDRSVDDLLDEGYTVPERDRSNHFGETALEELTGESLDLRLSEEEPDIWDAPEKERRQTSRAGRLVADPYALDGRINDIYANDAGIDGGAASAEEAAVHIVDEI